MKKLEFFNANSIERNPQVFRAAIVDVRNYGLVVELPDALITGLVHVSSLADDFYLFEPAQRRLIGRRSRKRFGVGDEVRVFVVRVDAFKRQVDFAIASETPMKTDRRKVQPRIAPDRRPRSPLRGLQAMADKLGKQPQNVAWTVVRGYELRTVPSVSRGSAEPFELYQRRDRRSLLSATRNARRQWPPQSAPWTFAQLWQSEMTDEICDADESPLQELLRSKLPLALLLPLLPHDTHGRTRFPLVSSLIAALAVRSLRRIRAISNSI